MNINWKVRVKSKTFWLAIIPAVILLLQAIATPFGYHWDFGVLGEQLTSLANAAFGVLVILGVVADPTTEGIADSARVMTYTRPGSPAHAYKPEETS